MRLTASIAILALFGAILVPPAAAMQPTDLVMHNNHVWGTDNCNNPLYIAAHPVECAKNAGSAINNNVVKPVANAVNNNVVKPVANAVSTATDWTVHHVTNGMNIVGNSIIDGAKKSYDYFASYCPANGNVLPGSNCPPSNGGGGSQPPSGQTQSPIQLCAQKGGTWTGSACNIPMTPAQECAAGQGYYAASPPELAGCYQNKLAFDSHKCGFDNNYWTGTACKTLDQVNQEACRALVPPGVWVPDPKYENDCWESREAHDATACVDSGKAWYNKACLAVEDAAKKSCEAIGGAYLATEAQCYDQQSLPELCESSGFLWVTADKKCYVMENAQIPKGLEKFFYVARTAQEKALLGKYQENLNQLIAEKDNAQQQALVDQAAALKAQHDAEQKAILDEANAALQSQAADYQAVLDDAQAQLNEVAIVNGFIQERLRQKFYIGSQAPQGSFEAIRSLVGLGDPIPDVSFSYPSGFPTPTASTDGKSWVVKVPLKITFPQLAVPNGTMQFQADRLVYSFSTTGGKVYTTKEVDLAFDGGGDRQTRIDVNLQASYPKSNSNNDLRLVVGLIYTENYDFDSGRTYSLESYRESQPLDRTFYTNGNPLSTGSGSQGSVATGVDGEGVNDDSNDVADSSGNSPSGAAGSYNWVEYQQSRAEAAAEEADAKTGFGLGLLAQYWYVFAGLALVGIALWRGWFRKAKARFSRPAGGKPAAAAEAPDLGLDLGDDLLGGTQL